MILDLMKRWPIIEEASVMIGDREADATAGRAAGITAEIVRDASLEGVVVRMLGRIERSLVQRPI
jgi:phosphoglycolate phosphatase-like HAD superfamily hydrolase